MPWYHMLQPLTSAPILLSSMQIYDSWLYKQNNPKYLRYPAEAKSNVYFTYLPNGAP